MNHLKLKIPDIKTLLKRRFLSNKKDPANRLRPLYLEGHSGIGKTQCVVQVADELSKLAGVPVQCKILNLQFCERPDFMGLPSVVNGRTIFARPSILPDEGYGILFLDEANRVDMDIRSGMLTLLEDRNINGHKIADGWIIVLAGNPLETRSDEGQYEVSDFDTALADRVSKVIAEGDIKSFVNHMSSKYPKTLLTKFLEIYPHFVSFNGKGVTPRTFEYALRATSDLQDPSDNNFYLNLAVEFGTTEALFVKKLLELGSLPNLKKVKAGDPVCAKFLQEFPNRIDVMIAILDELSEEFLTLKESMQKPEATHVANFVKNMPIEVQVLFKNKMTNSQLMNKAKSVFAGTAIAGMFNEGPSAGTRSGH